MKNGKTLIQMADACERRAKEVESGGDSAQLKLIAKQLKEMAMRELERTSVG